MGATISVCSIVKNEAGNLRACRQALEGLVDEWIVVDTGSSDDTKLVAAKLGARVFEFSWDGSFSRARNFSLEQATCDFIVVIDADDRLQNAAELRSFIDAHQETDAFSVLVMSHIDPELTAGASIECVVQPRVFRRSASVRYEFPVHNQPRLRDGQLEHSPGRIIHVGYQNALQRRAKAIRSLDLLQELPEDSPHRLYHTARTFSALGHLDRASALFLRLRECRSLPPDGYALLVEQLVSSGRPFDAIELANEGLSIFPGHPDLLFAMTIASAHAYESSVEALFTGRRSHDGILLSLGSRGRVVSALRDAGLVVSDCRVHLVIVMALWKRPALSEIILDYYARQRLALHDKLELTVVAVGSEGETTRRMVESRGFIYCEAPNSPLGAKWNYGVLRAKHLEPTGVVIVGSDNVLSPRALLRIAEHARGGVEFVGFSDCYLVEIASGRALHWTGYQGNRKGEPIGVGRFIHRLTLDDIEWRLWNPRLERGLDRSMATILQEQFARREVPRLVMSCREADALVVDFKSDQNMWSIDQMAQTGLCEPVSLETILEGLDDDCLVLALRRMAEGAF